MIGRLVGVVTVLLRMELGGVITLYARVPGILGDCIVMWIHLDLLE